MRVLVEEYDAEKAIDRRVLFFKGSFLSLSGWLTKEK
jgi:hypothetical protein